MTKYLQQRTLYPPIIERRGSKYLGLVVVIPAYNEPYLIRSLIALQRCQLGRWGVEVIVIINDAEGDAKDVKQTNQSVYKQALKWSKRYSTPRLRFEVCYQGDLPDKFAGVGLARKIGMDEACYRFEKIKRKRGIIVCLDADSVCSPNYFQAIEAYFQKHTHLAACSIYFEHPLHGAEYEPAIYDAIAAYELHLRYFIQAQRWVGVPYAYQTVGSAMAVRSDYYQQQGGMNRRKAGEDFYFLHKFIALGKCGNLTNTTVFPSPRISNRVPFGTGKAVQEILNNHQEYQTYHPKTFQDLKAFLKIIPQLYTTGISWQTLSLPESIHQFLSYQNFEKKLLELQQNTSNQKAFVKRFYHWFNAFLLMKFAHFARDNFYGNIPVSEATQWFLEETNRVSEQTDIRALLLKMRALGIDDK